LYRFININYLPASVVGYGCGVLNSYVLNKKWTFKTINVRSDVEFAKFFIISLAALIVNIATLKFLVVAIGIKPEISQILVIGFSLVVNFIGNKFWTFQIQCKLTDNESIY
jgi:putative flippase GtrA